MSEAGVLPEPVKGMGVDTLSILGRWNLSLPTVVVQVNAPFYNGRSPDLKAKGITQGYINHKQQRQSINSAGTLRTLSTISRWVKVCRSAFRSLFKFFLNLLFNQNNIFI